MATALTVATSHPALFAALPTPPATPLTPTKSYPIIPRQAPIVNYALLRSHHVTSLKYVIAKLRWEQTHNGYIRGEDAWLKHNRVIQMLEDELHDVEAAQKGLDRFPNCFAPVAFPKPHGPPSKEQLAEEKRKADIKDKELDAKLDKQFPWLKQLFIGPMTKQQARNNKMLRDQLKEGDFDLDDIEVLLPSENLRMAMGEKKPSSAPKKTYEQVRMEKERAKVAAALDAAPKKEAPLPKLGPMTKDEWIATLPVAGPKTRHETLLPAQRDQRHAILTFLRKPWPVFDEEAAGLMNQLGKLAVKRLNQEAKETKEAEKARVVKA